jgi:hypothetical protein
MAAEKSPGGSGKVARGSPAITAAQRARFIKHLTKSANVSQSARLAGFNPRTAYDMRDAMPDFAQEWADALLEATDSLKGEARRRAMDGVPEPVTCGKGLVMDPADSTQPLLVRRYSDTIMLAMLRAHCAEYRPEAQAIPTIPAELQPDPPASPDEEVPTNPVA